MFGVDSGGTLYRWFKTLSLNKGYGSGTKYKNWNKEGWLAWLHGADPEAVVASETPVEEEIIEVTEDEVAEVVESAIDIPEVEAPCEEIPEVIPESPAEEKVNSVTIPAIVPIEGSMTFNCPADQAFDMMSKILGDTVVSLKISWFVQ